MTILDGLKKIKLLKAKAAKTQQRIIDNCCSFEGEEPIHNVRELIQSHTDLITRIHNIKAGIQCTNATTDITETKYNTHTIASLIAYRQSVLPQKITIFKSLSKATKENEGRYDNPKRKIVLHYNPKDRDLQIDKYEEEIIEIDAILDKYNVTTVII